MVDCCDGPGNVVQRLGNIVLRVIVLLRRNERAYDADWPTRRGLYKTSLCLR